MALLCSCVYSCSTLLLRIHVRIRCVYPNCLYGKHHKAIQKQINLMFSIKPLSYSVSLPCCVSVKFTMLKSPLWAGTSGSSYFSVMRLAFVYRHLLKTKKKAYPALLPYSEVLALFSMSSIANGSVWKWLLLLQWYLIFSSLFFLSCMDFSETGINACPFLSPAEGTITAHD